MQISKSVLTDTHFSNYPKNYMLRLICEDGFFVSLLGTGSSVRQIGFPSRQMDLQNLALSFSQESTYFSNPLYAGATLAPTAGRISHGSLSIGNHLYELSRNEHGIHSLHGGFENASFRVWELCSASVTPSGDAQVSFTCALPDGLDGFPGNRPPRRWRRPALPHPQLRAERPCRSP